MVTAMGSSETLKHSNFFVSKQSQPPMDVHIVDDEVSEAVGGDADTRWYKCAKRWLIEAEGQQNVDCSGQDDREEVVRLKQCRDSACRIAMVTFVKKLSQPVHHPSVGAVGEGFHEHECQSHNQYVLHSTTR